LVKTQGVGEGGLLESLQKLASEDLPQSLAWEEKLRGGRHPMRPILGKRPTGDECVEMEGGLQGLLPGMEDHDSAELAAQMLTAKLEKRGTGGAQEQAEQEPFVAKEQRMEGVREGENGVNVGSWQEFRPPGRPPVGLGDGLTLGTVPVATRVGGVAFEAALRTRLGVAPELRRATGHDGFHHFGLCGRDWMRVPRARAVEATNVGNCPRRRLGWRGRSIRMDTAPPNSHRLTPRPRREWPRESTRSRGDC